MNIVTIQTPQFGTSINARDLHSALELKKDFSDWIKAQLADIFQENQDWVLLDDPNPKTGRGGRPRKDYALTLDTAKHIALMSRTAKGREYHQALIELEAQYHSFSFNSFNCSIMAIEKIDQLVRLSASEKLGMVQTICRQFGLPVPCEPEESTRSLTETGLKYIHASSDYFDPTEPPTAQDSLFAVKKNISSESLSDIDGLPRKDSTRILTRLGYTRSRFRENGKRVWGVSLTDRTRLQKTASAILGEDVEIVTHEEMAAITSAADLSVMGDPISAKSLREECEKAEVNYKTAIKALTERYGYVASRITSGADKGARIYTHKTGTHKL